MQETMYGDIKIKMNGWRRDIVVEVLDALPEEIKKKISEYVKSIEIGDEREGNGHYHRDGSITVSFCSHPRYFIELVLHEIGHGLEKEAMKTGDKKNIFDAHEWANGFPLYVLYLNKLEELCNKNDKHRDWKAVCNFYKKIFNGQKINIDTEKLIKKYEELVKKELEETKIDGEIIYNFAKKLYEQHEHGYLNQTLKYY